MSEAISPDMPELRLWAQLVGIAPSRLAAAFNDPLRLHEHITFDEMNMIAGTAGRLAALQARMLAALELFMKAKGAE